MRGTSIERSQKEFHTGRDAPFPSVLRVLILRLPRENRAIKRTPKGRSSLLRYSVSPSCTRELSARFGKVESRGVPIGSGGHVAEWKLGPFSRYVSHMILAAKLAARPILKVVGALERPRITPDPGLCKRNKISTTWVVILSKEPRLINIRIVCYESEEPGRTKISPSTEDTQ